MMVRNSPKFEETGVRTDNADFDTKATFKELLFHIGGHLLHSLFWGNFAPQGKGGGEKPSGTIT